MGVMKQLDMVVTAAKSIYKKSGYKGFPNYESIKGKEAIAKFIEDSVPGCNWEYYIQLADEVVAAKNK